MTFAIIFLLALNVIAPVWAASRYSVSREGLTVDHVLMFSLGYVVYWILPIAVGAAHLFPDAPAMALWYGVFHPITEQTQEIYLVITLLCYSAFWFGSFCGRRQCARRTPNYKKVFFSLRMLDIPLAAGILIAILYAFLLRDQFFRGYTLSSASANWDANRGSFTAASLFLLSLALIYSMKRSEGMLPPVSPRRLFFNRYFVVYFVVAILVASLGGRLYLLSTVVMLLVCWTVYFRRISGATALYTFLGVGLVTGVAGVVRLNGSLSTEAILTGLFQEPLFTGFSLINYLQRNSFDLLRFPLFLGSDLINLVPSALLPNKLDFLLSPADYGFSIFNPLGAVNSFFSFMINFGVIGTLLFLFLFGWLMSLLRGRDSHLLSRVIYIMLTGWIGFTFFRDDFQISLVKSMLQFSVLVPALIVVALQIASVFLRDLHRRAPEIEAPDAPAQGRP